MIGHLPPEIVLDIANRLEAPSIIDLTRTSSQLRRLLKNRVRLATQEWREKQLPPQLAHISSGERFEWPSVNWWEPSTVAFYEQNLSRAGVTCIFVFESGRRVDHSQVDWQHARHSPPTFLHHCRRLLPCCWQTLAGAGVAITAAALFIKFSVWQKRRVEIALRKHQELVASIDPAVIQAWERCNAYTVHLKKLRAEFDHINSRLEWRTLWINGQTYSYQVRVPHPVMPFDDYWKTICSSSELSDACLGAGYTLDEAKSHLAHHTIPSPGPSPIPPGPSYIWLALRLVLAGLPSVNFVIVGSIFAAEMRAQARQLENRVAS